MATMYDLKRHELINLEQGSQLVAEYKQKFVSLASFVVDLHVLNSMLVKMFEDHSTPSLKDRVSV